MKQKHTEHILVVKRDLLLGNDDWQGIKSDCFDTLTSRVEQYKEFHERQHMEEDATYKQIIPYVVFMHNNRYFLMQRKASASERRLKNRYSLGIGGHMREEDLLKVKSDQPTLFQWAEREFYEEVDYQGSITVRPLGVINDDTTAVGRVHIGFALLVIGDSDQIKVKSELKSGQLLTLEQCRAYQEKMEQWSIHVMQFMGK